jgi:hypothetical protein
MLARTPRSAGFRIGEVAIDRVIEMLGPVRDPAAMFPHWNGLRLPAPPDARGAALLAIRPERIALGPPGIGFFDATLWDASFVGDQVIYTITREDGSQLHVKERNRGDGHLHAPGTRVGLSWRADAAVIVDP